MVDLSVLLIVRNEEKQLEQCLKTIKFAEEIVVVLDKCTDNSKKIAKKYTNKIYEGSWDIEGKRRNYGIQKCNGRWIFEIDADERVPNDLKHEILSVIKSSKKDWHLINVKNFFGRKIIKFGWGCYIGKSSYAGLFKKNCKTWGMQRVHPEILLKGKKGKTLEKKILHFYCKSIFDLFSKLNSYSTARAKDLKENENNESFLKNLRRIFSRFWKCYILRKGFKEKDIGLAIAITASLYPILSYLKYKIENEND
ncbi:MAG: glycosyl transferase [Alphaproteobacteria bacterium]|nr:glycosyl transferase [Alphaproteobacteria bacterium]|tara:strand:+ start:155 stop:913 length:759 start_codon:yes stop_codon:yes gene_type:complete